MKVDISKGGKENILVLTDASSKYSQAFMTSNQKSLTVAKLLVRSGSVSLAYLLAFIVIKVDHLTMK